MLLALLLSLSAHASAERHCSYTGVVTAAVDADAALSISITVEAVEQGGHTRTSPHCGTPGQTLAFTFRDAQTRALGLSVGEPVLVQVQDVWTMSQDSRQFFHNEIISRRSIPTPESLPL